MYILGHAGFTAAAARAVDREADLRLVVLLSLLPDILDKPTAVLLPALVNGNTRSFGHTLLGASAVLALLLAGHRRLGNPLLLWACYAGHLLLDRMWLGGDLTILCWPLLGAFPPWSPDGPGTPFLMPYNLAGEALGLGLMLRLARNWRPAPARAGRPPFA